MQNESLNQLKIIVERQTDGYVGYPLGLKRVVVGEGDTFDVAVADTRSAIRFPVGAFSTGVLETARPVVDMVPEDACGKYGSHG